ncbi:MAG: helix-turn-helix transcriptional regulator [Acinetobacter sp.]
MSSNEFEIGYTPNNLKALRAKHNLTQKQVAEITDTKAARTISKWETDLDDISHADMPAKKWRNLLKSLNYPID